MSAVLSENRYGKSCVRLLKVERTGSRHSVRDLNLEIQLSGDFAAGYQEGDNRMILPTDTMKNTVYAFARRQQLGEIEEFGQRLTGHFLNRTPAISKVKIEITETRWNRIRIEGQEHDHAFIRSGGEERTAAILENRAGCTVIAGIAGLAVLKTARSGFKDFFRDDYTTLKEASDRLLGTVVKGKWTYAPEAHDYGVIWQKIRETILEVFASHDSRSVQHTLFAIGETVLTRNPEVTQIELSLPNRHCLLVDLAPFGLDNPNEVFVPAPEPFGVIEAVLTRS